MTGPRQSKRPPGQAPALHTLWRAIKENPGLTSHGLEALAERYGYPGKQSSLTANVSSLAKRDAIRREPIPDARNPGRTAYAIFAKGEAYPAAKTHPLERKPPSLEQREPIAAPAPEPEVIIEKGFADAPSAEPGSKVKWHKNEVEAICRLWAKAHLERNETLSEHALMRIARIEGEGFRPRPKISLASARLFLAAHTRMLKAYIRTYSLPPLQPPMRDDDPVHPQGEDETVTPEMIAEAERAEAEHRTIPPRPALSLGALIGEALEQVIAKALAAEMDSIREHMTKHIEGYSARITAAIGEVLGDGGRVSLPFQAQVADILKRPPPPPKLPKVIVVNALGAQFESIKRAYPSGLDLRLVNDRMPGETDAALVISMNKSATGIARSMAARTR
jgi:hypothetical protein